MRNRMRETCTSGSVMAWRERSLLATRKRVKGGLKAAKARGKHIVRKKMKDSDLIRKLRAAGMTYRNIATISKYSHGAVHARHIGLKPLFDFLKFLGKLLGLIRGGV